ncbi:MAG: hypothetical protein BWX85_01389 [Chloroflexi bacterium ADurb.Bin120]|jgi:hypothetical protein|uniref:Uncharacterized protein n=1 Tax=Candidatus Brevifilum fermentans TaxID=1986204 RepID=A0A1Y6K2L6_9CHLR|nr:hypothetical protein [Brevefilum fermentans]OQB83137.1 MAG: hypothetical protein BWX85_01389 [Chloroflexi bacterium ADurb.Bin120]SMX53942.1 protein of unknown function [Brevefilum fermentans]
MTKKFFVSKLIGLLFVFFLLVITKTSDVPAQSTYEPQLDHSACVYHCMMDQNFIHSKMGYGPASSTYYQFMTRFWETSGCKGVGIKDILETVIAVSGAPGGATMSCYQLLLAETLGCANTCRNANPSNSAYGANVKLTATTTSPGYLEVGLDNRLSSGDYLDYSNGYSGRFYLTTTLQLGGGTPLAVGHQFMPSMSFPNWITSQEFGAHKCTISDECPSCCEILWDLDAPSYIPTTVEFLDGVLYDLTDQAIGKKGVTGSFSNDGYVVLLRDGDTITINQGPYAGVAWTKAHNKTTKKHT